MRAFCSSPKCLGSNAVTKKVEKENALYRKHSECPDCGYSLIWEKDRVKHRVTKMVKIGKREKFY